MSVKKRKLCLVERKIERHVAVVVFLILFFNYVQLINFTEMGLGF